MASAKRKRTAPAKKKKLSPKKKRAPKKALASKKKTKRAPPKTLAPKKKRSTSIAAVRRSLAPEKDVPPPPPSFHDTTRALVERPRERSLTDEERTAMRKVADTARRFLATDGMGDGVEDVTEPGGIIVRIGAFIDAVRSGARPRPKNPDVELGLGILWGEQLRAQVGWLWVHLTYPNHFYSYALVPDDRAFACFPVNRLVDLMRPSARTNTSVRLFEAIRSGELPAVRKREAYLVIG